MNEKMYEHIILIGFMGSGKSSVARRIARWEHLSCIDMDSFIERQEDSTIADIFRMREEAAFRDLETAFLLTMPDRERTVLSCGGGIVIRAENRAMLTALGTVIYLQASAEEVMRRISNSQTRPLLKGSTSPAALMAERQELYESIASFTVDTDGRDINQVAREVIRRLKSRGELCDETWVK